MFKSIHPPGRTFIILAAVGIVGGSGLSSITQADAATVRTACINYPGGGTGSENENPQEFTTDEVISGPLGVRSVCADVNPSIGGRLESTAKVQSSSDFGASSSVYIEEGLVGSANADGTIFAEIVRRDASETEIPYTISELTLEIQVFDEAEVYFSFGILEAVPDPSDPANSIFSPLRSHDGYFNLSERGNLEILATDQAGFEAAFTQGIDVPIAIEGPFGTKVRDTGTYDAKIASYSNALDISDLTIGKEYYLNYLFSTSATGRFAQAVFQDPIDFSGGGIDALVFASLTDSSAPAPTPPPTVSPTPAAVPLPASSLFLLSGFLPVLLARRRRGIVAA